VISDAITHPERYVLKPQREGGGNNLYGDELAAKLREVGAVPTAGRRLPGWCGRGRGVGVG